ncbi:hypothetical protein MSKU15_1787 [Komagataeibacter diospyri]|nr:hypothetical protein MSKU15_1787 [Komagataeibacter diospyri]
MAMIFVDHSVTLRLPPFFRSRFCPLPMAVNPDHRTIAYSISVSPETASEIR